MLDLQQDQVRFSPNPSTVPGVVLFTLGIVVLGILIVGNAFLLDFLFKQIHTTWVVIMLCLEIAIIMKAISIHPYLQPAVRWHWVEIIGIIVVGGAFLAHAIYLAPKDLMPVSPSVDCSHQHLLVNYIFTHSSFPDGVDYLYIYDDYPVMPSALAAFLAGWLRLLPVQTMYSFAVLLMLLQVIFTYGIVIEVLPFRPSSCICATLAVLMLYLVYPYSIRVFTQHFYSNMIMGDLILLATLWLVVIKEKLSPILIVGVSTILIFGCLHSYPAWLPFVVAPVFTLVAFDQRIILRKRWRLICAWGLLTLVLIIIAIVEQWDFITWFAPSRDRRLIPSWQTLGGVLVSLLAAWGVWILIRKWRQYVNLILFIVLDIALVISLYSVAMMDKLTLYIPDKTFYFNVFLLIILAALSIHWIWERIKHKLLGSKEIGGGIAVIIIVVLGLVTIIKVNRDFPQPATYPITLDEYRVAYHLSRETQESDLTYLVRNGTVFYWIYGCILNNTHDLTVKSEQWQTNTPTYERWINDSSSSSRAIVSDLTVIPNDGPWYTVLRSGNSALIEKVQ